MAVASKSISAPDQHQVRRALISVSDKRGLIEFAKILHDLGIELISTGGTAKAIEAAKIPVKNISDLTGFPEILNGRVKTLHPSIHGAILGLRDNPEHVKTMEKYKIAPIDMVVVDLYPFEETSESGSTRETIIENIDIGGSAMIRAAAKNHAYVAVVTDPDDYEQVVAKLNEHKGALPLVFRQELAARGFARTSAYDAIIANWFAKSLDIKTPVWNAFAGRLHSVMRYGDNPHQSPGFHLDANKRYGVATATTLQGKKLSYNNINDTDAAIELVSEFTPESTAAVAIIKHTNPCGVATGDTLKEAYQKALACDPVSAFGGIVALNRTLDGTSAEEIIKTFTEVIVAPDATEEARAIIGSKGNLRLLVTGGLPDPTEKSINVKTVSGGLLVQSRDDSAIDEKDLKIVTKRKPTEAEMNDMLFAFRITRHVKSNAVVYVKGMTTVGIGAGQVNRIDSARIAERKARDAADYADLTDTLTKGSVVASDTFFPVADDVFAAVEAGATAIIQPGGSIKDDEVIAAADKHNIAMVFTNMRHFRH